MHFVSTVYWIQLKQVKCQSDTSCLTLSQLFSEFYLRIKYYLKTTNSKQNINISLKKPFPMIISLKKKTVVYPKVEYFCHISHN